jgi:hypothetical protein
MSPVFSEMGSDAVSPGRRRCKGRPDRIRMFSAAGIPDRRHVIDIYTESQIPVVHSVLSPKVPS